MTTITTMTTLANMPASIWGMTVVLGIALIGTFAVFWRAIPSNPNIEPAIFRRFLGEGRAIHALVVFMVVASAFYLAADGKLTSEVGTLLSGVAGFAFGSMRGERRKDKASAKSETA